MILRPQSFGMTAILAMLTALGPLSTDLYLPSLPSIARELGADTAQTQLTLSAYLVGFAIGQIFYGPIADRIGRKPAVLAGLALYCLATIGCALAGGIEALVGARFVQALGAAGPVVMGRAIVRDVYEGSAAGRQLSRMGMIMGLVPAIAPVIGGVLEPLFGWRSNFWAVLGGGAALALAVILLMPETLREKRPDPISPGSIFREFRFLLGHDGFRLYAILLCATFGGLFSFISGSSFVLQQVYGLGPLAFGLSFGFSVFGYISGTIVAQRVVGRLGLDGTIRIGVLFLATGGALMLILMLWRTGSSLEVTIPMTLYTLGVGMVMPQANASAMMPFPERAGAASSLQGVIQNGFAALAGALLGMLLPASHLMMPLFIAVMGAAGAAAFWRARPGPLFAAPR